MKKVVIVLDQRVHNNEHNKSLADVLKKIWGVKECEAVIHVLKKDSDQASLIQALEEADYICTLDMAGFDITTMTETYYYNICMAKQMHIIVHEKEWKKYENGEFALNMYFFFPGEQDKLRKRYEQILDLYGYETFDGTQSDEKKLDAMVSLFLADVSI